jgi:hypothetical protein
MNLLIAGSSMRVNTDGTLKPHSEEPNEIIPTCKQPLCTAPPERKLRGETAERDEKLIKKKFSFRVCTCYNEILI